MRLPRFVSRHLSQQRTAARPRPAVRVIGAVVATLTLSLAPAGAALACVTPPKHPAPPAPCGYWFRPCAPHLPGVPVTPPKPKPPVVVTPPVVVVTPPTVVVTPPTVVVTPPTVTPPAAPPKAAPPAHRTTPRCSNGTPAGPRGCDTVTAPPSFTG